MMISENDESVTTINSAQTDELPVPLPEMLSDYCRDSVTQDQEGSSVLAV
jgi:hypothetical protein